MVFHRVAILEPITEEVCFYFCIEESIESIDCPVNSNSIYLNSHGWFGNYRSVP